EGDAADAEKKDRRRDQPPSPFPALIGEIGQLLDRQRDETAENDENPSPQRPVGFWISRFRRHQLRSPRLFVRPNMAAPHRQSAACLPCPGQAGMSRRRSTNGVALLLVRKFLYVVAFLTALAIAGMIAFSFFGSKLMRSA